MSRINNPENGSFRNRENQQYMKAADSVLLSLSYRFLTADNIRLVLSRGSMFYAAGEGWFRKRVKIIIILIYIQLIFIVIKQSHNRP